jgi:hypothetical protein
MCNWQLPLYEHFTVESMDNSTGQFDLMDNS